VASTILPRELGGQEKLAVYFDHDMRVSLLRLQRILQERLRPFGLDKSDEDAAVRESMERMLFIRCAHDLEVLTALEVSPPPAGPSPS
jgi:hypothetical protein